jgi:hypothetical protein
MYQALFSPSPSRLEPRLILYMYRHVAGNQYYYSKVVLGLILQSPAQHRTVVKDDVQANAIIVVMRSFVLGYADHLELYVKVRLNTRPTYQRQQKFGRGPVIHKTRVLRGSSNPQWREDFMVCEIIELL